MITAKVNELIESRGPRRGGRPVESEAEKLRQFLKPHSLAAETLEGMMPSSLTICMYDPQSLRAWPVHDDLLYNSRKI